jgi:glycosyltransferase involved in cell wall biosynthesis
LRKLRILYIYSGKTSSPGWLTAHPLVCEQVEWIPHGVEADGSMARIKAAMLTPHSLQQVDLIISSEYYLSVGVNLRLLLTGCKTPHVVWGLNQSRKLLRPPGLRWLVNRVFNRADRVVTHSREESLLFQHLHQIPASKFSFAPWGYDLPPIDATPFLAEARPYVCLVGRNNRDLDTFTAAVQKAGVHGVIITSSLPADRRQSLVDQGVEVFENLSFERCLACLRDSLFSAVLLNDSQRGAGHITIVSAMMLGKAQVVSDASVIQDYVINGEHALNVPLADVDACARAFSQLLNNPELAAQMGQRGRAHALAHYTNDAIARELLRVIHTVTHG